MKILPYLLLALSCQFAPALAQTPQDSTQTHIQDDKLAKKNLKKILRFMKNNSSESKLATCKTPYQTEDSLAISAYHIDISQTWWDNPKGKRKSAEFRFVDLNGNGHYDTGDKPYQIKLCEYRGSEHGSWLNRYVSLEDSGKGFQITSQQLFPESYNAATLQLIKEFNGRPSDGNVKPALDFAKFLYGTQ